ncbi:MAG: hypothetical protein R3257_02640, partial [bacterium]|nr:hypothetical protein [bacterium]
MGTLQRFYNNYKNYFFSVALGLLLLPLGASPSWAGDNECSGADYDVTVVGYSGSCNIDGSPSTVVLYNVDAPDYCKDISNIVICLPDGSLAYVNTDHTLAYSPAFSELAVNLDTFNK